MNSAERLLRLLPPAHDCNLIDCNEHETSAPEETAREADTQRLKLVARVPDERESLQKGERRHTAAVFSWHKQMK